MLRWLILGGEILAYQDWINEIDIGVDYYAAFIKAWIAFNSWYNQNYSDEKTDAAIIARMQLDSNDFRVHLMNLLKGNTQEAAELKSNIGNFHEALVNANIRTQERTGKDYQITFSEVATVNKSNRADGTYRGVKYTVERKRDKVITKVVRLSDNANLFYFEQDIYDEEELSLCSDFCRLTPERKEQCIAFYKNTNPYKIRSLLVTERPEDKDKYNLMGSVQFLPDVEEISKGVIEVLYVIRCALMHGDISPNNANKKVYRYGYEILTTVLKKLR